MAKRKRRSVKQRVGSTVAKGEALRLLAEHFTSEERDLIIKAGGAQTRGLTRGATVSLSPKEQAVMDRWEKLGGPALVRQWVDGLSKKKQAALVDRWR